jgi:hypothetical protein
LRSGHSLIAHCVIQSGYWHIELIIAAIRQRSETLTSGHFAIWAFTPCVIQSGSSDLIRIIAPFGRAPNDPLPQSNVPIAQLNDPMSNG